MLSLTLDYSDDFTYSDDQQDKSTAIKSKLIYSLNVSFDIFLVAEKTKRDSDQYDGIQSDKSLLKAGVRLNF